MTCVLFSQEFGTQASKLAKSCKVRGVALAGMGGAIHK